MAVLGLIPTLVILPPPALIPVTVLLLPRPLRAAAAANEASQLRDMLSSVINKAVAVALKESDQGDVREHLDELSQGLVEINVGLKEGKQVGA